MRAAIYSRFSSDLQRSESIEDQERVCLAVAERNGWEVVQTFSDRAMSGASAFRPRYQEMLKAAQAGKFEILIAESLDRLSRDQEDVARLHKVLNFAGVVIVTSAEGERPRFRLRPSRSR